MSIHFPPIVSPAHAAMTTIFNGLGYFRAT